MQYTVLAARCHVYGEVAVLAPEDRETRRQAYADAVWRIVERDGAERTSMRAIAAEAGTSLGMLQHHFADKNEILALAIRGRIVSKQTRLERAIRRLGAEPDPARVLVVALHHQLPLTLALRREAWVLQRWLASDARSPLKEEIRLDGERVLSQVVGGALEAARAQGRLAEPADLGVLTDTLLALRDGLMQRLVLGRITGRRATEIIETEVGALLDAPMPFHGSVQGVSGNRSPTSSSDRAHSAAARARSSAYDRTPDGPPAGGSSSSTALTEQSSA